MAREVRRLEGRDDWSPVVGNVTSVVEGASVRRGSGIIEGNGEIRFVPCL